MEAEVIIIGAGISGLVAARELTSAGHRVLVLEARDVPGGRIREVCKPGFTKTVQAGAEFIHGELDDSFDLLRSAGIGWATFSGEIWQKKKGKLSRQEEFIEGGEALVKALAELKEDKPVALFLEQHFPGAQFSMLREEVTRFVEGYDAADTRRASSFALREEFIGEDDEQYYPAAGYFPLVRYLTDACSRAGGRFMYGHPVKEVAWERGRVRVRTAAGEYEAQRVLVTVPLGVLLAREGAPAAIRFSPGLPEIRNMAADLGYGGVIKYNLQFKERFWEYAVPGSDLSALSFLLSDAPVPTWWTYPEDTVPILTGWLAGPAAAAKTGQPEELLLTLALDSLSQIFGLPQEKLRTLLTGWDVADWLQDPYSLGAYSYATVGAADIRSRLSAPVSDTIWFCGEALAASGVGGTVDAAIISGKAAARGLLHILG